MSEFVRYEVVQTCEVSPLGVHRYRIYGIRPDGMRSVIDMLYLREHDVRIQELEAKLAALSASGAGVDRPLVEEMRDFLRGTDPCEPRHIITAHWLSKGLVSLDCISQGSHTDRCDRPDDSGGGELSAALRRHSVDRGVR
jgi:hypothetical protein